MSTLTPEEQNLLVTILKRGLAGGNTEVYRADRYHWEKDKPDIEIPEDKHRRIEITQEVGDKLTETGYLSFDKNNHRWRLTVQGVDFALNSDEVSYTPLDIRACLEETFTRAVFHPLPEDSEYPGETPIPWIYKPGSSRLVLVLGENAGGKSFFRRVLQMITHPGQKANPYSGQPEIPKGPFPVREMIHISMQGRTKGGMVGAFVYGTEEWRSTGENSAYTVSMGIKTSGERTHTSIMYWDEPDIGMSAGTSAGAGMSIRDFVTEANPLVQMVCVTSHSPALVQQLRDLDPHYIYLGDPNGPATLDDWFEYQVNPRPVPPDEVRDKSHHRFLLIRKILKR